MSRTRMTSTLYKGILLVIVFGAWRIVDGQSGLDPDIQNDIDEHRDEIDEILDYITNGAGKGVSYQYVKDVVDRFGPRHTCTQALEDAIDYLIERLEDDGFHVYTENVQAPKWIRGKENAQMLQPIEKDLHIMSLFESNSTSPEGLQGDVLVVKSFDELDANSAQVSGKIVVYNQEYVGYSDTSIYRREGAARAARHGAIASLTRSVTDFSIYSPHTGSQTYDDDPDLWIPTAAITVEDAELMQRYQDDEKIVTLKIVMDHERDPAGCVSRNVVAEIEGIEYPDEVVIVGGHYDSWDVGRGAMDDMGGVAISWQALNVVRQLGYSPKRTMRFIAYTAEEIGIVGGNAYYDEHKDDGHMISLAMESDAGTFVPHGIGFEGSGLARAILEEIISSLDSIDTTTVDEGTEGTADLNMWKDDDVPVAGLGNNRALYFWYHHTHGDDLTVYNPDVMDSCAVVWTVVSYVVADLQEMLPREGEYPEQPETSAAYSTQVYMLMYITVTMPLAVISIW